MAAGPADEAFRTTLELFETGVALMRQQLIREQPDASGDEIERRLLDWLRQRPGAEHGDCSGRPVDVSQRLGDAPRSGSAPDCE